jgi:hypothetical protein
MKTEYKPLIFKAKLTYLTVAIVEDEEGSDDWCIDFNYDENEKIIITNTSVSYVCSDNLLVLNFENKKAEIIEIGACDTNRIISLLDKLATEYLDKLNESMGVKNSDLST